MTEKVKDRTQLEIDWVDEEKLTLVQDAFDAFEDYRDDREELLKEHQQALKEINDQMLHTVEEAVKQLKVLHGIPIEEKWNLDLSYYEECGKAFLVKVPDPLNFSPEQMRLMGAEVLGSA